MKHLLPLICLASLLCPGLALAEQPTMRYGVVESMGYPFNLTDNRGYIRGGLLLELGEKLAHEVNATLQLVPLSRRRVDRYLLAGDVDLVCYYSPNWSESASQLHWSMANLPQVERIITIKGVSLGTNTAANFVGKRVSTQLGYHYPAIQDLFDKGQARRMDEVKVDLMFRSLQLGLTDMLISSEGEIQGFFHAHPQSRALFEVSKAAFSVVPTQCAVSPQSRIPMDDINRALARLLKRGELEKLAKPYGIHMR